MNWIVTQPGNPTLDAKNDDFKTVGENKEEFCIALDELTTDFQKLEIQVKTHHEKIKIVSNDLE